ncbi:MAG: pyruvate kinase alpha/beta domain-containing protein [Dehalococcoidia bacterium]|nr:pyruvate kinase alpha/beta domain-containing protein [Dehalococcoidia bacterium]
MEGKIVYFEGGSRNDPNVTQATLELVKERLKALGIKKVVLASTAGDTALKAMEFFKDTDVKLIIVPHQFGRPGRDKNPFPQELVGTLRAAGHEVYFGTMLFHVDRFLGTNTPQVMANLLRCFSQGVKVCFEIVMMATDGGHLSAGERVIAVAGTGRGADTALVMQASSSSNLMKLRVNEMLCKPLNPLNIDEVRDLHLTAYKE